MVSQARFGLWAVGFSLETPDLEYIVVIGKAWEAYAQSFAPWQQATIEIMRRNLSYYCLLAPRIYILVLRAHPVCGESHNQCNATSDVATISITSQLEMAMETTNK